MKDNYLPHQPVYHKGQIVELNGIQYKVIRAKSEGAWNHYTLRPYPSLWERFVAWLEGLFEKPQEKKDEPEPEKEIPQEKPAEPKKGPMILENTATLRIHMYTDNYEAVNVNQVAEQIHPKNAVRYTWIPQTLGDQIWLWFEFATPQERVQYLLRLPKLRGLEIATNFTQEDLNHWTK